MTADQPTMDVRTFVDIRAFSAAWARQRLSNPAGAEVSQRLAVAGTAVDHMDLLHWPTGAGHLAAGDESLFLQIVDGSLTWHAADGDRQLSAGAAIVVPAGARFAWSAREGVTFFQMARKDAPNDASAFPVDAGAGTAPSASPAAAVLLTPAPECRKHLLFQSQDGGLNVGIWEATPYARVPIRYGFAEFMHLLEGDVTITDDLGNKRHFTVGAMFLVFNGAVCAWDNPNPVRKLYVTLT